jgi:hypothetical protein
MTKVQKNFNNTTVYSLESAVDNSLLLDTLAQPDGNQTKKGVNPLKKRAISKYLTNKNIFPLIDLNSSLKTAYWNSYHCTNVLLQDGQTVTGRYCNNRWCLVCNRIRTAKLINGYLPVIKSEFKNPYFVTLTIPNVDGADLRKSICKMISTFIRINRQLRDQKKGIKGIRKIECTYNSTLKNFHPHFHLLVDGTDQADVLISAWLDQNQDSDRRAQDSRPADDNSLIELFKYSTKMTTETDNRVMMSPDALDLIFKALYKIRTYQPIGIKKIVPDEDIDELQAEQIEELKSAVDVWIWEQELRDWINSNGEFLTDSVTHESNNKDRNGTPEIYRRSSTNNKKNYVCTGGTSIERCSCKEKESKAGIKPDFKT